MKTPEIEIVLFENPEIVTSSPLGRPIGFQFPPMDQEESTEPVQDLDDASYADRHKNKSIIYNE